MATRRANGKWILGIKLAKVEGQGLCIDLGFTKVRERETVEHCPAG